MEKGKAVKAITTSLQKLDLTLNSNNIKSAKNIIPTLQSSKLPLERPKTPSLVSLCLGVVGKHFEDIIEDLGEIAASFPADIKMAMAAIARRRKLLNDEVVIALAESSWEILDLSGSDVSDFGLSKVAEICKFLRAVDISRCSKITWLGVSELVQHCHLMEILRCGGCPRSDYTARRSLGIFKPKLNDVEEESWEELDTTEIAHGAQSLRWLVWPKIDKDSLESLSTECPRIIVNPKPSPFGYRGIEVPREALPNVALDDPVVKDVDPKTWAVSGFTIRATSISASSPTELPMAEKFRLAFVERDTRLAPKRAKNARQQQRRAEREWVMTSATAKAIALASNASRSLHNRN
uniref:RNI-like superfamily protein n=1 Tax=Davidia involucrata TaxID=16924 RepID=A0A5B7C6W1_DAVIN